MPLLLMAVLRMATLPFGIQTWTTLKNWICWKPAYRKHSVYDLLYHSEFHMAPQKYVRSAIIIFFLTTLFQQLIQYTFWVADNPLEFRAYSLCVFLFFLVVSFSCFLSSLLIGNRAMRICNPKELHDYTTTVGRSHEPRILARSWKIWSFSILDCHWRIFRATELHSISDRWVIMHIITFTNSPGKVANNLQITRFQLRLPIFVIF